MSEPVLRGFIPLRPPTVNNLFVNSKKTGGRFPSPEYKQWRKDVGHFVNGHPTVHGHIRLRLTILRPSDRRRRDVANFEKAFTDLLVEHDVIEDDCLIECITLTWAERLERKDAEAMFEIWEQPRGLI